MVQDYTDDRKYWVTEEYVMPWGKMWQKMVPKISHRNSHSCNIIMGAE